MPAVSNSSPLIFYAVVSKLNFLHETYGEILIPPRCGRKRLRRPRVSTGLEQTTFVVRPEFAASRRWTGTCHRHCWPVLTPARLKRLPSPTQFGQGFRSSLMITLRAVQPREWVWPSPGPRAFWCKPRAWGSSRGSAPSSPSYGQRDSTSARPQPQRPWRTPTSTSFGLVLMLAQAACPAQFRLRPEAPALGGEQHAANSRSPPDSQALDASTW
jgi:hypothetical protein